jgi:hypothetical protein
MTAAALPARRGPAPAGRSAACRAWCAAGACRGRCARRGCGQQAQLQPAGSGGAGFLDEAGRIQPARHGDREQRLVVQVARAGGDHRDRQVRIARAQGFGQLPAGAPGTHDDHPVPAAARRWSRTGWLRLAWAAHGLQAGRLVQAKNQPWSHRTTGRPSRRGCRQSGCRRPARCRRRPRLRCRSGRRRCRCTAPRAPALQPACS